MIVVMMKTALDTEVMCHIDILFKCVRKDEIPLRKVLSWLQE